MASRWSAKFLRVYRVGERVRQLRKSCPMKLLHLLARGGGVYANLGVLGSHKSHKQAQLLGERPELPLERSLLSFRRVS